MAAVRSDRRLCVTADRSELVEETDPRAAFLLVQAGGWITDGDVVRYGVTLNDEDQVVIGGPPTPETKAAEKPEDKMVARPEDKAADATVDEAKPLDEEWTLKSTPAEYLERFPDGPKAELAQRILAAETASGDS